MFTLYKNKKNYHMKNLEGKRIAILTDDGFEQVELTSPKEVLINAGAQVDIVSPQKDKVRSKKEKNGMKISKWM